MISRRDKLLNYPWQQLRYEQHREKVHSAKPAIDFKTPPSYNHVILKPKKLQSEKERLQRIETENVRLLQKLGDIMRTKRLENFWIEPRPNFLSREKLFETRPYSSLPKLIAIYAPSCDESTINGPTVLKSPHSRTVKRCPTCCGKPERTLVVIPEQRIPWEPLRKTINVQCVRKSTEALKKCMHCGHLKQIEF